MNRINKANYNSIDQVRNKYLTKEDNNKTKVNKHNQPLFSDVLDNVSKDIENSQIKFSKHATQRLSSRNINLSEGQLEKLETGTDIAKDKGVKDSLVVVDDIAFIVNINSRTVVTAVNETEEKSFTNNDGAVIM